MQTFDAIVIGSGFGGAMAARQLVHAGWRVLMLERGGWVERGPHNWAQENVGELTGHYCREAPYRQLRGGRDLGAYFCVGGPSVFYGGVSLRFREQDFEVDREIVGDSGARWPLRYADLEPYYNVAERILGVAGVTGEDPTEPPRSEPYPHPSAELAPVTERIARAARELGLAPFRLPLAINRVAGEGRGVCQACGTCDGFACAVGAKNDLTTAVIGPLLKQGLLLEADAVVTRLLTDGRRVTGVEVAARDSGERTTFRAREVILAAGALGTPQLLLASELARLNPGGQVIGRYLQRHYNEILFGIFPTPPNPGGGFHKQIGIHDFYFGHPSVQAPAGKLGGMQQLPTPPVGLVRAELPRGVGAMVAPWIKHLTGLLVMAEDQPVYENRVLLDESATDRYGVPRLLISHQHTSRDRAAGAALAAMAKRILRRAGALACYRHQVATFSHGVGTVRMGSDAYTSALDADCRYRGLENLTVVDASVMPTGAAVNPSLTISAIALRAAERLAERHVTLSGAKGARRGRMPQPVSLAFLGCGVATRTHSKVLAKWGGDVLRYYASRDPKLAEEYSRKFGGAGSFGSYAAAMADPRVQAIVICTPPDSHLELTLAALKAGKHVVLEKPAFFHADDFEPVRQAEAQSGRRLMVAENYCYKPVARVLRETIASGALGEVRFFNLIAVKSQRRAGWRDDPAVAGGGALFEGGVHWIDLLANVGLEVESAQGFRPDLGTGLERSMLLVVQYRGGGVGMLAHSWDVASTLRGLRISRIYGTKGSIAFESNGIFVAVSGGRTRLVFPGLRDINGNRAMWTDFLDVIRTGREPVMTARRAQRGLELVEIAYRTAEKTGEGVR